MLTLLRKTGRAGIGWFHAFLLGMRRLVFSRASPPVIEPDNRWVTGGAPPVNSNQGAAACRRKGEFWRRAAQGLCHIAERAGKEIAAAAFGLELAVLDDDAAARNHGHRPAMDVPSFIGGVAGVVMQHRGRDRHLAVRVPDADIGIRADRDRAFFWVEPV